MTPVAENARNLFDWMFVCATKTLQMLMSLPDFQEISGYISQKFCFTKVQYFISVTLLKVNDECISYSTHVFSNHCTTFNTAPASFGPTINHYF